MGCSSCGTSTDDYDSDGFTELEGDCDDCSADKSPGNTENVYDGIDNDCDNLTDTIVCDCTPTTGQSLEAMSCASEISCQTDFFGTHSMSSPTGDDISSAWTAVTRFGDLGNNLSPRFGGSYSLMATGPAEGTGHNTDLTGGTTSSDPYSTDGNNIHDVVEYTVTMTAPANVVGFSIDYVFFSEEYDDFVGTAWAIGVGVEILLLLLAPRFMHRVRPQWMLAACAAVAAGRWFGLAHLTHPAALLALQSLHGVTFGLWYLSLVSFVQTRADERMRTTLQSIELSCVGLGMAAGYLAGGRVFDRLGGEVLYQAATGAALLAMAGYLAAAMLVKNRAIESTR